jgi:hypothetical protein
VIRPNRQARRQRGKSDAAGAVAAALAALNGEASGVPKSRDGAAESIRMLQVARCGAVKARTQAANQLRDLIITAPEQVRHQLAGLPRERRVETAARFRPRDLADPCDGARAAGVSGPPPPGAHGIDRPAGYRAGGSHPAHSTRAAARKAWCRYPGRQRADGDSWGQPGPGAL